MTRTGRVAVSLLAANLGLLGATRGDGAGPATGAAVRVGLVFDVGGRGDKSFNDAAYRGLQRAVRELGAEGQFIEPGEGADREAGIRLLAAQGFDLVVGVGFIFTDDVTRLAREYPGTAFACVDYALMPGAKLPPNLAALKFREEEGSALVGAAAALVSRTRAVGFVGGMDMPLIHKFEAGYRAGVRRVCPDCRVLVHYAGVTPHAFKNPGKGKELALAQIAAGADVIYHASGSTGLGVFEAVRATGKLAIGVDSDQHEEAPGHILTSMVKGVDVAVFETARAVKERRFSGGVYTFGLREGGVDYVRDQRNRALLPDPARARVEALRREIVAGRFTVPAGR